jgi:PAS domain S-box-containing protein
LGHDTKDFLGLKGVDFIHPGDLELLQSLKEQLAAPGAVAGIRMRIRHKDGSWRWMDGTLTNHLDDPSVGARVYNLQDCTARQQAEEELSRSEARFQHLADAGVIGILEIDSDGAIHSANDAFLKMVGREGENVAVGHLNLSEIDAPEYRELTHRGMAALKASGTLEPYEKEYVRKDGSRVPVLIGGAGIETGGDRFISFAVDLSKLAQAREETRRSEQRYRNLFENANDAIVTYKPGGQVTSINLAGERLLGYTREELLDRDFGGIWAPESQAANEQIFARAGNNELPERFEVEMLTHRRQRVHAELSIQPIHEGDTLVEILCIARDLSEKGILEEQLRQAQTTETIGRREAKELLQSVTDSIPTIVFMTDEHKQCVFHNQAWSDFTGQPREAGLGHNWLAYIHPDDAPSPGVLPQFDEAGYFKFNNRMKRFDGEYRWMAGRGRRHLRADGTFAGLVGVITDITDQRQIDDRIRTLSTAVEQSPVSIVITDAKGTIEYVNPNFTAVTGYSAEEAIGQNSRLLKSGRTSAAQYTELWKTIQSGEWRGEFWNKRKNGELFLELASISPVRNQLGELTHFLAVKEDITEQRKREKALRHAEELNQRILESAQEGIIVTDPAGEIQYMSPGALKFCDNPDGLRCGSNWLEFWRPEYRLAVTAALRECSGGKSTTVQGATTTCQGNNRWLEASLTRMEADQGIGSQIMIVNRDITERRQMEMQLAQAQKLESIGQLAAGIAHEINTPIQYVGDNGTFIRDAFRKLIPYVESLEAIAKPAGLAHTAPQPGAPSERDFAFFKQELPRAAEELLEGVETVARIVRAMKDFSHPCAADKTDIDLNRAIESVITVSRNEWKYVAEMKTDLDPDLPLVSCLPGEINQVVLNLIVNATHAIAEKRSTCPPEGGMINVRTRSCDGWVEIRVGDNGAGIPEAIRPKIFDPFFTTKEVGKGTGQGLAIAHDVIVQKHGGSISVETEIGKGTTFIVRLPLGEQI